MSSPKLIDAVLKGKLKSGSIDDLGDDMMSMLLSPVLPPKAIPDEEIDWTDVLEAVEFMYSSYIDGSHTSDDRAEEEAAVFQLVIEAIYGDQAMAFMAQTDKCHEYMKQVSEVRDVVHATSIYGNKHGPNKTIPLADSP